MEESDRKSSAESSGMADLAEELAEKSHCAIIFLEVGDTHNQQQSNLKATDGSPNRDVDDCILK